MWRDRLDGLASREEELGIKIVERFEGRPDYLVYRSVRLTDDPSLAKSPYTLQVRGRRTRTQPCYACLNSPLCSTAVRR